MLSDAEQRRLAEIETLLRVDDPDFVRRFDKRRLPPRRRSILALELDPAVNQGQRMRFGDATPASAWCPLRAAAPARQVTPASRSRRWKLGSDRSHHRNP